ncbi:MAG: hypothetical protein JJ913_15285 [Rhizobiaceae bacterium]|nr:hypothetical protein [Rhizobiaceae bacterium]
MCSTDDWRDYQIEQIGEGGGHCDCCGDTTRRVWGFVKYYDEPFGAYYLGWTVGKPDHGAAFDLVLGNWSEDAPSSSRFAVSLDYRLIDGSGAFMVVDAEDRIPTQDGKPMFDVALKRTDVIGTALAPEVFAIVDAIFMSDSAGELRSWSESIL